MGPDLNFTVTIWKTRSIRSGECFRLFFLLFLIPIIFRFEFDMDHQQELYLMRWAEEHVSSQCGNYVNKIYCECCHPGADRHEDPDGGLRDGAWPAWSLTRPTRHCTGRGLQPRVTDCISRTYRGSSSLIRTNCSPGDESLLPSRSSWRGLVNIIKQLFLLMKKIYLSFFNKDNKINCMKMIFKQYEEGQS